MAEHAEGRTMINSRLKEVAVDFRPHGHAYAICYPYPVFEESAEAYEAIITHRGKSAYDGAGPYESVGANRRIMLYDGSAVDYAVFPDMTPV